MAVDWSQPADTEVCILRDGAGLSRRNLRCRKKLRWVTRRNRRCGLCSICKVSCTRSGVFSRIRMFYVEWLARCLIQSRLSGVDSEPAKRHQLATAAKIQVGGDLASYDGDDDDDDCRRHADFGNAGRRIASGRVEPFSPLCLPTAS